MRADPQHENYAASLPVTFEEAQLLHGCPSPLVAAKGLLLHR
jgi:hypothetical protein